MPGVTKDEVVPIAVVPGEEVVTCAEKYLVGAAAGFDDVRASECIDGIVAVGRVSDDAGRLENEIDTIVAVGADDGEVWACHGYVPSVAPSPRRTSTLRWRRISHRTHGNGNLLFGWKR